MLFKISCLYPLLYSVVVLSSPNKRCLTGYMTDVQSWVDEKGRLTRNLSKNSAVDLAGNRKAADVLQQRYQTSGGTESIRYVGMANCGLKCVPKIFRVKNRQGISLAESLEYLTLYGNEFGNISSGEYDESFNATDAKETASLNSMRDTSKWYFGFQQHQFSRLRELDLRACTIQVLDRAIFINMPQLEALYLSENNIVLIRSSAFIGLHNLIHLDLSRNNDDDKVQQNSLAFESMGIFQEVTNLSSLDFSFTRISSGSAQVLARLGKTFKRLSICSSSISRLPDNFFSATSITHLDVSGNNGIFNSNNLEDARDTLQILYADNIGARTFTAFRNLKMLEILKLDNNEIDNIDTYTANTLENLQVLYLDSNRISVWFNHVVYYMPKLKLLSLRNNNINLITDEMLDDFNKIRYLSLSGNLIICNCQIVKFYEMTSNFMSDNDTDNIYTFTSSSTTSCNKICYHTAFEDINNLISAERRPKINYSKQKTNKPSSKSYKSSEYSLTGLTLFDYNASNYECLFVEEGIRISFAEFDTCVETRGYDKIERGTELLFALLLVPGMLLPLLAFVFIFRRKIKYFLITLRNSATLSVINDPVEDALFFYDVFVSYCHDDRDWVLDNLLPHIEQDCNINVCLHERDFQVGLSILENIISCMDRSRLIVLVLSMEFLKSQWCKFEMHLAQHRLLETRREDLILILLEDIPRDLRPNTLQYLMLTKTYIIWPKELEEQETFWRRLKKSLTMYRNVEKVSIA